MSELRTNERLGADAATPYEFGIVVSRFNKDITSALLDGALATLRDHGATGRAIYVVHVPGAFELPMAAAKLAGMQFDAIICLGALIKGETPHFEHLCTAVANGVENVAIRSGVPTIFGVLTCEHREHAEARAGGARGNKGAEAALAAIEMATLFAAIDSEC